MTQSNQILATVKKWTERIGKQEAIRRLVLGGVAPVTAEKICGNRYHSTPGGLLSNVLISEMSKDGFTLDEPS